MVVEQRMALLPDGISHTDLLAIGEAAMRLSVHPNTVRRWTALGILNAYRIGSRGDRRFRPSDIDRLMQTGT